MVECLLFQLSFFRSSLPPFSLFYILCSSIFPYLPFFLLLPFFPLLSPLLSLPLHFSLVLLGLLPLPVVLKLMFGSLPHNPIHTFPDFFSLPPVYYSILVNSPCTILLPCQKNCINAFFGYQSNKDI